jgi:hypothetical protein
MALPVHDSPMLVTDDFVFLHIPKTAGTFIKTVIRAHLPVIDRRVATHAPYSSLPRQWRHLPGFYVVRNPWDWYVSWFHWTMALGRRREELGRGVRPGSEKEAVWVSLLRSGQTDFKEAVYRACTGDFDHPLAPMIRREGIDFYSAHVKTIAGEALDRPDFTALKFERFRKPLVRFLHTHAEVPAGLAAAVHRDAPERASEHGDYRDYYDDELRALVKEKTGWLCERFDYKFRAARTPEGHT